MKIVSTKENLQILYQDNHLIAINKRVGDIVQKDISGDTALVEIVKQYLCEKYQKKGNAFLGVVHRLDRPTSGVVIFAKTSKALSRLNAMFASKEKVVKTYWAITENVPPKQNDNLVHWLLRDSKKNKCKVFIKEVENSKKASLQYRLCQKLKNYSFLEINLQTGRHHQIRAQLSFINCPIKGDLKYGAKRSNDDAGICLHAKSLSFEHPVTKSQITITAPTPYSTLWNTCEQNYLPSK